MMVNVIFSFIFHTLITFSHVTMLFSVMVNVIFSSATVAAIIAYLLDCTHPYWEVSVRKDSGWHWWEKFKFQRQDARSEEFYPLPYGLSRYFPRSSVRARTMIMFYVTCLEVETEP
jgi:hypothetical protein